MKDYKLSEIKKICAVNCCDKYCPFYANEDNMVCRLELSPCHWNLDDEKDGEEE